MEALRIAVYIAENYHSSSYTATNDAREREREHKTIPTILILPFEHNYNSLPFDITPTTVNYAFCKKAFSFKPL